MTPRHRRRVQPPLDSCRAPLAAGSSGGPRRSRLGTGPALALLAALSMLISLVPATSAPAQTVAAKRAEAARVAEQLEAQGVVLSQAAERYNQAQARLGEVRQAMDEAQAGVAAADAGLTQATERLADAAIAAYTGADPGVLGRILLPDGDGMVRRSQYLRLASADQSRVLGEVRAAREDLELRRQELANQEAEAERAAAAAESERRAAAEAEAAQRALLSRVEGELATLVAEETAARERAQAAAARPAPAPAAAAPAAAAPAAAAPAAAGVPATRGAGAPATDNPPSEAGAIAVAEARKHIGKPYVWGGSGPNSFDCSGLTAYAWNAAGVYLPHSAYLQYVNTPRVAVTDIRPGDLLFFGPNPSGIHHNAIYVGGGQMIEASQTGVPVRYRGWRSKDLVGIGRPG